MNASQGNAKPPRVVAVVLNWNGTAETLSCLASLAEVKTPGLEVVVVDNGSRDSPRSEIERRFPEAAILENDVNLGYAGGNNKGIAYALERGAEFVWILNNDLRVAPDALDRLLDAAREYPRAAVIGGKVLRAEEPSKIWVAWGRVTWLQSLIALVGEDAPDSALFDVRRRVRWLPGCALLMRASALRELGGFEEAYFAYHEDVEWAERARRAGWQRVYDGTARTFHAVHGSSGGPGHYGGFRKYLSARNSVLFARTYGRPHQIALMAISILVTLPFQWIRRALRGEGEGVRRKVQGWLDALRGRPIPLEKLGLRERRSE